MRVEPALHGGRVHRAAVVRAVLVLRDRLVRGHIRARRDEVSDEHRGAGNLGAGDNLPEVETAARAVARGVHLALVAALPQPVALGAGRLRRLTRLRIDEEREHDVTNRSLLTGSLLDRLQLQKRVRRGVVPPTRREPLSGVVPRRERERIQPGVDDKLGRQRFTRGGDDSADDSRYRDVGRQEPRGIHAQDQTVAGLVRLAFPGADVPHLPPSAPGHARDVLLLVGFVLQRRGAAAAEPRGSAVAANPGGYTPRRASHDGTRHHGGTGRRRILVVVLLLDPHAHLHLAPLDAHGAVGAEHQRQLQQRRNLQAGERHALGAEHRDMRPRDNLLGSHDSLVTVDVRAHALGGLRRVKLEHEFCCGGDADTAKRNPGAPLVTRRAAPVVTRRLQ